MADLIDRQAIFDALPIVTEDKRVSLYGAVAYFRILVSELRTVDAVEVVRCKDCKWGSPSAIGGYYCCWNLRGMLDPDPNDFRSYGERREENAADCRD